MPDGEKLPDMFLRKVGNLLVAIVPVAPMFRWTLEVWEMGAETVMDLVADVVMVGGVLLAVEEVAAVGEVVVVEEAVAAADAGGVRMLLTTRSVRPRNYEHLLAEVRFYFDQLDVFKAPFLEEKLRLTGEIADSAQYEELFAEFKKYVALLAISQENLGMVGKKVDRLWHQYILFTREYMVFSEKFFGKYIHHTPYTSLTPASPEAEKRFHHWYHKVYGPLPAVWKE